MFGSGPFRFLQKKKIKEEKYKAKTNFFLSLLEASRHLT